MRFVLNSRIAGSWRQRLVLMSVLLTNLTACEGTIVDATTTAAIASFEITPAVATADGASQLRVTTSVAPDVAVEARSVTLATTLGTFGTQATIVAEADRDRKAVAMLTAPSTPGTALVTAKVGSSVIRREVTFERAFAESVDLSSDATFVASGYASKLVLTITLRRAVGKPTAGDSIAVVASAGLVSPPTRSNAEGVVTATYTPGDTPAGLVTLSATAFGAGGRVLADSLVVRVLPKS